MFLRIVISINLNINLKYYKYIISCHLSYFPFLNLMPTTIDSTKVEGGNYIPYGIIAS